MAEISPSILSADFANLEKSIKRIEDEIRFLHIDVMDGHFVPNLTIGAPVVAALRKKFDLVLDVHLMISNPLQYVEDFVNAGSDFITVHAEANMPLEAIRLIKKSGVKAGISIKPNTPVSAIIDCLPLVDMVLVMSVEPGFGGQKFMPSALDKIRELVKLRKTDFLINVDGGINEETGKLVLEAGADVIVAGNYIFNNEDPIKAIRSLQ